MSERKRLRIFLGMIAHETNSFSPIPTSLRTFEQDVFYRGDGDPAAREKVLSFPGYGDLCTIARECGDEVIEGLAAWTQPSGPATAATYEALRDGLVKGLREAGPVDFVFLNLHGAMLAQGYDDCEGDIVAHVRAVVGPTIPIGVLLDLHGNVGQRMLDDGAIIIAGKDYPHTDYRARSEELYALLTAVANGGKAPRTYRKRAPVLGLIGTTEEPMRSFVESLTAMEGRDGLLAVSMMHGFPWSDAPDTGASVLIVSDGSDMDALDIALKDVARRFVTIASQSPMRRLSIEAALDEAVETARTVTPVVVADGADNPGGGAACDSTFLLRAMIDRRIENAALGMIWDPQACAIAADAGVGARIALRIGGKVGPLSGDPVDLDVEVLAVRTDPRQRGSNGELTERLGLAVAVRAGGIDIVLNSIRQQVFSIDCFTELDIDLAAKSIVVVKSSQHFRASFDEISGATIYCNAPGSLNADVAALPFRNVSRPLWPLDPIEAVQSVLAQ